MNNKIVLWKTFNQISNLIFSKTRFICLNILASISNIFLRVARVFLASSLLMLLNSPHWWWCSCRSMTSRLNNLVSFISSFKQDVSIGFYLQWPPWASCLSVLKWMHNYTYFFTHWFTSFSKFRLIWLIL